jgi:hypothetical protein
MGSRVHQRTSLISLSARNLRGECCRTSAGDAATLAPAGRYETFCLIQQAIQRANRELV